jgi:hypothetical protein
LGPVGGEDAVLHLATHPAGPVQPEQVVEDAVVIIDSGDVTAERK